MPHNQHPIELKDAIRSGRAVAATDTSMDGNLMASHWMLTSLENQLIIEGGVKTKSGETE